jgi:short-subunit dehydrogenase
MRPIPSSLPALVTGASSGIGAEFARQLAQRGHNLTLVARREDRLRALAAQLAADHGVEAAVLVADLETSAGRRTVADAVGREPLLLINNAGFGSRGRHWELSGERESAEVEVNVLALQQLCHAALAVNVPAGRGGVINVASTAGFQPLPYMATYAATKAFVLHYSEALARELSGTGVRLMALCPGPVATEFGEVAGNAEEMLRIGMMPVEKCVSVALRAFDRNHTICVPGVLNHAGAVGTKLVPRALLRRAIAPIFRPR